MKKKVYLLLGVYVICFSLQSFSISDSLYPFTDNEILKLSTLIYELEKKDSLASAMEPNGFELKDRNTIHEMSLLVDVTNDSVHYYTGLEIIKLSNYIFELEKRDSIRRVNDSLKALKSADIRTNDTLEKVVEFHLDEEKDVKNFESVIFFSFNSSSLTPESYKAIDEIVKILKTYLNLTFVVEGYTDDSGSPSYNKVLSIRRAKAVKEYFVSKGIMASRVVSVAGYGGVKYMYSNSTEEDRAKNRNVIIKAYH